MDVTFAETRRKFLFTQKELKEKLGIIGDVKDCGLWCGQSPKDLNNGKDCEGNVWFIEATEQLKEEITHNENL